MTVELKLDASAMNALFPEGSEARVKLQAAVIADFAQKSLAARKAMPELLIQTIEGIAKNYADELRMATIQAKERFTTQALEHLDLVSVKEVTVGGSFSSKKELRVELAPAVKTEIASTAASAVRETFITTVRDTLKSMVEENLKSDYWQKYINARVQEAANAEVLTRVQAAIAGK